MLRATAEGKADIAHAPHASASEVAPELTLLEGHDRFGDAAAASALRRQLVPDQLRDCWLVSLQVACVDRRLDDFLPLLVQAIQP